MTNEEIKKILKDQALLLLEIENKVNFKLNNILKYGGQGAVYKGELNGNSVAIKFYFPGDTETRIDREIRDLKKISNPNIVKLYITDDIQIHGRNIRVVASEFIEGMDLEKINKSSRLTIDELKRIALDITNAISDMTSHNIVHRDLKPENIMIKKDGSAVVIDLGIAKHLDQSTVTEFGKTCGTPGYMSPEQAYGSALSYKSDIFSLGVIIVECILRRHPTDMDQKKMLSPNFSEVANNLTTDANFNSLIKSMLNEKAAQRPTIEKVKFELAKK